MPAQVPSPCLQCCVNGPVAAPLNALAGSYRPGLLHEYMEKSAGPGARGAAMRSSSRVARHLLLSVLTLLLGGRGSNAGNGGGTATLEKPHRLHENRAADLLGADSPCWPPSRRQLSTAHGDSALVVTSHGGTPLSTHAPADGPRIRRHARSAFSPFRLSSPTASTAT
ncbi:hypothetical protein V2G26_009564 [Clonostachys chloroleuca]